MKLDTLRHIPVVLLVWGILVGGSRDYAQANTPPSRLKRISNQVRSGGRRIIESSYFYYLTGSIALGTTALTTILEDKGLLPYHTNLMPVGLGLIVLEGGRIARWWKQNDVIHLSTDNLRPLNTEARRKVELGNGDLTSDEEITVAVVLTVVGNNKDLAKELAKTIETMAEEEREGIFDGSMIIVRDTKSHALYLMDKTDQT